MHSLDDGAAFCQGCLRGCCSQECRVCDGRGGSAGGTDGLGFFAVGVDLARMSRSVHKNGMLGIVGGRSNGGLRGIGGEHDGCVEGKVCLRFVEDYLEVRLSSLGESPDSFASAGGLSKLA